MPTEAFQAAGVKIKLCYDTLALRNVCPSFDWVFSTAMLVGTVVCQVCQADNKIAL